MDALGRDAAACVRSELGRRAEDRIRGRQPQRDHPATEHSRERRASEALVPEPVRRDDRHAEAAARDDGRQSAGHLEDAQHRALAQGPAMTPRHRSGIRPRMPAAAGIDTHPPVQFGVRCEVGERFVEIAEVADPVERAGVGFQVDVDQPRVLAGARELAEPAADRRQQPENHPRSAWA